MPKDLPIEPERLLGCVHYERGDIGFAGFSIGYDAGVWREGELVSFLFRYLPEFALKGSELVNLTPDQIYPLLIKAARVVYTTVKYERRGEIGELLLHAILKKHYETIPAITKLYYKDGANETVKGYDAVHITVDDHDQLELWLGESKFYADLDGAVYAVAKELFDHTQRDYFRAEMRLISHKIEDTWPHADKLRRLIDDEVSLDHVFSRVRIPVLLTYNSAAVRSYDRVCDAFLAKVKEEFEGGFKLFKSRGLPEHVCLTLMLVPLCDKDALIAHFDAKLKAMQQP